MDQQQELQQLAEALAALDEQSAVSVICSVLESRPDLAPSVVAFSVPDLTYAPIRAFSDRRSEGTVKSFNQEKGFGFILCDELKQVFQNDVFLSSHQFRGFQVGEQVSFAVALNKDNKPQAYDLRPATGYGGGYGKGMGKQAQVAKGLNMAAAALAAKGASMAAATPQTNGVAKGKAWANAQSSNGKSWQQQNQQNDSWNQQSGWNSWSNNKQEKGQAWPAQSWNQPAKRKSEGFNVDPEKIVGDYQGYIKSFNPSNGYGFIVCEALKGEGYMNDVFLHQVQFNEGGFMVGHEVEFTCFLNSKNQPQAINLRAPGTWSNKRQKS